MFDTMTMQKFQTITPKSTNRSGEKNVVVVQGIKVGMEKVPSDPSVNQYDLSASSTQRTSRINTQTQILALQKKLTESQEQQKLMKEAIEHRDHLITVLRQHVEELSQKPAVREREVQTEQEIELLPKQLRLDSSMQDLNESSRVDHNGNLQAPRRSALFEPDQSMYTVRTEEMTEVHHLMLALEEMKRRVSKTQKRLNHAKNKESKLLCLVYNLQSKGIPVNEIYTAEVKDIPTHRFGELANEEKRKREEEGLADESQDSSILYDFYSDDSFEYIPPGHDFKKTDGRSFKKPAFVPKLNFEELPAYETSSDEEEEEVIKEDMYQGGLQFINNFYDTRAVMERSPDSDAK